MKPEKCHCRKGYYGNRCQKGMQLVGVSIDLGTVS